MGPNDIEVECMVCRRKLWQSAASELFDTASGKMLGYLCPDDTEKVSP